jgi:hypothetical protein
MAIFGWSKPEMAAHATKAADLERRAADAIHLIREQTDHEERPTEQKVMSHLKKESKIK